MNITNYIFCYYFLELNNENKFKALLNIQTNYEQIPSLEKINPKCIDSFDETSENKIETSMCLKKSYCYQFNFCKYQL